MKKVIKTITVNVLAVLIVFSHALPAMAETITLEVTGNGEGSNSEINTQVDSETNIQQSNQSQVDNSVDSNADTGNNSADDNTSGEVSINTGDTQVNTEISNQTNTNVSDLEGCCNQAEVTQTISSNGADSNNAINTTFTNTNTVSQSNSATITTTITTTANTGHNSANNNTGGNISITTGNINHREVVHTQANNSYVAVPSNTPKSFVVTIKNNGAGSKNQITATVVEANVQQSNNIAMINNISESYLNTGWNEANANTNGIVNITTGNIASIVSIINDPINGNYIALGGCCEQDDPSDPNDPDDPSDPGDPDDNDDNDDPGSGDNGSSDNNDSGSGSAIGGTSNGSDDSGQVLGAMLPDTGFNTQSLLMINAFLLAIGVTVRFRLWDLLLQEYSFTIQIAY